MASLTTCPHMSYKCAHYNPVYCPDPASRLCHYVQNSVGTAVTVQKALAELQIRGLLADRPAIQAYLDEVETFLQGMQDGD